MKKCEKCGCFVFKETWLYYMEDDLIPDPVDLTENYIECAKCNSIYKLNQDKKELEILTFGGK